MRAGLARVLRASAFRSLPLRGQLFVATVDVVYLLAVAGALSSTRFSSRDLLIFVTLTVCALVSIEASLRLVWRRPQAGTRANDLLAVWTIPVMLLLPPLYSGIVVVPLLAFLHFRVVKRVPVKLLFSMSAMGLAGVVAATLRVHLSGSAPAVESLVGTRTALLATITCVALRYTVNNLLVAEVLALTKPGARLRDLFADLEYWAVTAAESCTGMLVAIACGTSILAVILAIPPVLVLQRTLLIAQFREAARTDSKTALANSDYWREVAERELARARSGHEPLAVLLADIDHFKDVNDRSGHLTGDEVLRAVAGALTEGLRPRDFVGRFGGEEFVVLLTGSDLEQARHAAERIRGHVAAVCVESSNSREPVRVTISIGVAAFRESGHSINEMLDAADTALYEAKAAGRNCVRVAEGARQQVLDLTGDAGRVIDLRSRETPVD